MFHWRYKSQPRTRHWQRGRVMVLYCPSASRPLCATFTQRHQSRFTWSSRTPAQAALVCAVKAGTSAKSLVSPMLSHRRARQCYFCATVMSLCTWPWVDQADQSPKRVVSPPCNMMVRKLMFCFLAARSMLLRANLHEDGARFSRLEVGVPSTPSHRAGPLSSTCGCMRYTVSRAESKAERFI